MSVKMRNLALLLSALAAALLFASFFSACESTLGFGKAIDFVLPELTLDPGPNPQYVTYTSTISGKITDNIAVDRVILCDADAVVDPKDPSRKALFTATLSGSDPREKRWSMVLDFREVTLELKGVKKTGDELNGERIGVEVVGYDQAGNSHVVAITLIIDMREPFTTDIEIERTSIGNKRTGFLEPLDDFLDPEKGEIKGLRDLETTDPNGFISANANKYQNGLFIIRAKLDENETRIKGESIRLNIYDEDHQDEPLLSRKRVDIDDDTNFSTWPIRNEDLIEYKRMSTIFSPVWPLLDEDIIQAGKDKGWTHYTNNAYYNGKRFYYRVEVVAIDESGNELHDYMGWFCMWQDGDIPKGILDPSFGGDDPNITSYVDRGTPLPVDFFDDDALDWAYAGLLTKAQWEGQKTDDHGDVKDVYIASNVTMPQFTNLPTEAARDDAKLEWLRNRFRSNPPLPVYNWYYDIHSSTSGAITPVADISDEYEKTVYIETGNQESDYGEFVLFTLTMDKKLPPHDPAYDGPIETLKPQWKGRAWKIQVIDSNAPLIVFDTVDTTLGLPDYDPSKHPGNDPDIPGAATGNSPEENTFPQLRDGQYFEINGYTLRENGNGHNSVNAFRLAWIPYGMTGGPDAWIEQVQNALSSPNYPEPDPLVPNSEWPEGVQHWDLHASMVEGTPQPIGGIDFRKQVFRKTFDVLGGKDDLKPEYYNFRSGGENSPLENETKLFVFYAKDNAGHAVFRQLRLLGNKTPPNIIVYDLTNRSVTITEGPPNGLPDLNNDNSSHGTNYYFYNSAGLIDNAGRARYEATRNLYQPAGFNLLKAIAMPDNTLLLGPSDIASTNAAYPRETVIKYWVAAQSNGDLAVDDVFMRDITFSDNPDQVGYYDDNISLSYIEKVSEVTQRVFLFEAKDSLGNTARIQRTVAVTNAAVLNSITTTTQTGSYGIGTTITLQANFTNLVRWTGTDKPRLNVRYNKNGDRTIKKIETTTPANTPSLSLDFDLVVMENDTGIIETIYFDIPNSNGYTDKGTDGDRNNRPITIPTGTSLLDASRGDDAFTPRNSAGFDWTTNKGSLQASKTITLQGVRPRITAFAISSASTEGKTNYTTDTDTTLRGYYFKTGETIEFTLTANNPIFTGTTAPVIQFQVGSNTTDWRNAAWSRSISDRIMSFGVLVDGTNTPQDGRITAIQLNDINNIVDSVGNAFPSTGTGSPASTIALSTNIHIDKTPPTAPATTLNGTAVTTGTATTYFSANPVLAITGYTLNFVPSGETAPVITQYSLNNGVTWRNFPTQETALGWTTTGTAANTLNISNGEWTLVTRYTDRAGNEGAEISRPLHINATFPNLIAVAAVNPTAWYKAGADLSFTLDFAEAVNVNNQATVQIVLTNRGSTFNQNGTGENNHILTAAANQTNIDRAGNTTITFNWTGITGKEMKNGMYISRINLAGLRDRFGNQGPAAANITYNASTDNPSPIGGTSGPFANPRINNLGIGVKVDAISPSIITNGRNPAIDGVSAYPNPGDDDAADKRNVITLTFREPVIKGNGTITIKPKSDFLIPPVFEDNGYYVDCVTEAKASASSNRTIWMPGFYDIYNDNALNATDRNRLTESTTEASQRATPTASVVPSSALDSTNPSMTRLRLDARTGQPVGPYVKTTQGLKTGYGYSGLYNGGGDANNTNSGSAETAFFRNGPNTDGSASGYNDGMPAHSAMIPDTATKWVLAYQYSIHDNTTSQEDPAKTANGYGKTATNLTGVVPNIRDVLVKTKFRWQEIDVAWSNVVITTNADGQGVATITLTEPLLKGLQWELSYPEGIFTDEAGNPAAVQLAPNPTAVPPVPGYTFWSEGVQKPVIRVNRKSYDARTSNWQVPRGANEDTRNYTYAAPAANSGWGITDFNTVDYRIESETPGAGIYYVVSDLYNSTTTGTGNTNAFNAVSVTGSWTGNVPNATTLANQYTIVAWDRNNLQQARSFWVRPNLIRRDGYSGGTGDAADATIRCRYYVNGDIRYSAGTLSMFRSYNRDATSATANGVPGLDTLTLSASAQGPGWHKGTVSFLGLNDGLEAGKRYVVAQARRTGQADSAKGYEGIFRTLIVLNGQTGGNRTGGDNGYASSRGKILVEGSNIKAGMPSVAGFPVQDGSDSGDSRFAKMMFNVDSPDPNATNIAVNAANNRRFYWVSTEIVCEWYFVYYGNGGRYMRTGDVNNYMMVSYGDLTYGYAISRFPD